MKNSITLTGITQDDIEQFVEGHKLAALYSSYDEIEIKGEKKGFNLDEFEISDSVASELIPDCLAFIAENQKDLIEYVSSARLNEDQTPWGQAGWDFWLTRQGHGVGYWDRDAGDVGDRLSEKSRQWMHNGLFLDLDENSKPKVLVA